MFCFPVSSTFVALLFATIHTIQSSSYFSFTVAEAEFSKNSAKYSGIYNGTLTLYSDVPDTALTAPFDPYTNDWTTTNVVPLSGISSLTDYGDHNWAQVDRLLYIIGQYRTTKTNVMYIYDLVSKTTTLKTPPNEQCVNVFGDCSITRVLAGGCVAYDPSRALIWYLSGYDVTQGGAKKMSQTYSISSQTWTDRPDMVWGTICGSCAMDQTSSSVYVFAGGDTCASDPNGGVQRYQYSADEWTMIISGTTTGIKARLELRCVLLPVNGYIYCMGGSVQFIENNNRFMESTKLVEVFNPATGTVIQTFNLNNYRERFQFVLLEPDCLYIFGGYAYVDRKYLDLTEAEYVGSCPTKSPTTHPTKNPTESPTTRPTKYPTIPPTNAPTKYPTIPPTKAPTKYPTNMPSVSPTETTIDPTISPTLNPTLYPITSPSQYPSVNPTHLPTHPTPNPINPGSWSSWVRAAASGSQTKSLETYDHSHITEFCVRSGALVDAIKVRWGNGDWSAYAGGGGGRESCYALADPDDCFSDIAIFKGDAIDSMQLRKASDRLWTSTFGGYGGSYEYIYAPSSTCLKGLKVEYTSVLVGMQAYYEQPYHEPSVAPTNPPTTATVAPSAAPIPPPTKASLSPSGAPIVPPSVFPSESPTTETSSPTAPTASPTGQPTTPSPTGQPTTQSPSSQPSASPTGQPTTPSPSSQPSASPTGQPTTPSPSSQPSVSPIKTPITPSPIQSTSAPLSNLHFVLRYKDKSWVSWYSFRFVRENDYVDIMKNALDGAFELIFGHSIMYSQEDLWESKAWTRAGMSNVNFCRFSDVVLSDDCPSYEAQGQEYVAIAVFDVVADQAVVEYVQYLRQSVRDEEFEDAFGEKMNELLDVSRRRNLLANAGSFEVVSIEMVDPVNDIFNTEAESSSEDGLEFIGKTSRGTVLYGSIGGGCVVLIVLIVCCVWCCKKRSDTKGQVVFGDDIEDVASDDAYEKNDTKTGGMLMAGDEAQGNIQLHAI